MAELRNLYLFEISFPPDISLPAALALMSELFMTRHFPATAARGQSMNRAKAKNHTHFALPAAGSPRPGAGFLGTAWVRIPALQRTGPVARKLLSQRGSAHVVCKEPAGKYDRLRPPQSPVVIIQLFASAVTGKQLYTVYKLVH